MFGDQVAIFAYPSQSASLGPASFQHRSRIYKSSSMYLADIFFYRFKNSSFNFVPDHFMIIFSISIFGNFGCFLLLLLRRDNNSSISVITDFAPGTNLAGIYTQFKIIFHVFHVPCMPLFSHFSSRSHLHPAVAARAMPQ